MPAYEFLCKKCGKDVMLFVSVSDYENKKLKCPNCNSTQLERQISPFQVQTSKKS